MKIIDLHCDTILGLLEKEQAGLPASLARNDLSIDLDAMEKGDVLVQNFALFTDRKLLPVPEQQTMRLMDCFWRHMEMNKDRIAPVFSYEDIERNRSANKLSALLTLEDGGVLFNDLGMLRNYYRLGVRMIALTWNYPNGIGYPNPVKERITDYKKCLEQVPDTEHGLTDFGKAVVKEMERLGMIVDVSHLSDAGFWDVARLAEKPFVASHSNARTICPVARNLSDEMIKALAQKGGIMGLNFCGEFLEPGSEASRVSAMVKHIKYIRNLAGIDCIAIGSDFDGIHSKLEIRDPFEMVKLEEALKQEGFTEEDVEKIFYKNALRVYKEVLK